MPKQKKSKRYNGRDANVAQNVFFEEFMKSVAKGEIKQNINISIIAFYIQIKIRFFLMYPLGWCPGP